MDGKDTAYNIFDYVVMIVSDKPILPITDSKITAYPPDVEPLPGYWDERKCPICNSEVPPVPIKKSDNRYDSDISYHESGTEYRCDSCGNHIYYAYRRKVVKHSGYIGLYISPFGPSKKSLEQQKWRFPKIPGWDNETCPQCGNHGLEYYSSDGCADCTGASSLWSVQRCPHCRMFVFSREDND